MFSGDNNLSHYSPRNFAIWMILAFQAGSINAGGFLACHKFVTHTTGFATFFGIDLASGQLSAALGMISAPLFFLAGAMTSAFFVDHQLFLKKPPRYNLLLLLIIGFMLLTTALGVTGYFGQFGAASGGLSDYFLLALLCLTSGIQNASISSASGSTIRTTHLTGITTDLGIGLVRTFSPSSSAPLKKMERKANRMRAGTIVSFSLGSAFSAAIFLHGNYWGFLVPALTTFGIYISGKFSRDPRKARIDSAS